MKTPIILPTAVMLFGSKSAYAQQTEQKEKQQKAYMVADAHLDIRWNWDIQTTIKEYVWNTLSRNLFLLKKYPD